MTLAPAPLQSRFGRRLLLLFVGCAVLPIALVAAVSYGHITRELRSQSEARLHQANKAMGLALYERLLLLDATLKSIPPRVLRQLQAVSDQPDANRMLNTGLDLLASQRFVALEFADDDGTHLPVFGTLEQPPALTAADQDDLGAGLPADPEPTARRRARAHVPAAPGRPGGRGSRHADRRGESGIPVGNARLEPPVAQYGDRGGRGTRRHAVPFDPGRSRFAGGSDHRSGADRPHPGSAASPARAFVSSSWPVLLDEVFAAPTWTLVLSESEDEVLGPLARFTRLFGWAVLLAGLAVLVLSGSQIQRSLVPLVELREGTRRIAHRDFGSRVSVSSRDEFEELATSFNAMAVELGRQFQALSTAAELDRAVLSATDAESIVDTLLSRTRDVFPCHLVGVTLVTPDGGKSLNGVMYDYCDEARHPTRVELRSEDVQDLLDGPDLVQLDVEGDTLPRYLEPLVRLGPRTVVVLPLRFRRQLVGMLMLGDRSGTSARAEEHVQIRRLADQVAVALANARMLEQVRVPGLLRQPDRATEPPLL